MLQKLIDLPVEYDDNWFLKEVKNGFEITGLMKRAWASQIKTLVELDRICEKERQSKNIFIIKRHLP